MIVCGLVWIDTRNGLGSIRNEGTMGDMTRGAELARVGRPAKAGSCDWLARDGYLGTAGDGDGKHSQPCYCPPALYAPWLQPSSAPFSFFSLISDKPIS